MWGRVGVWRISAHGRPRLHSDVGLCQPGDVEFAVYSPAPMQVPVHPVLPMYSVLSK